MLESGQDVEIFGQVRLPTYPDKKKNLMEKKYYKPVSDTQYQRATSCLVPSTHQSGSQIKIKLVSRFKDDDRM